MDFLGLQSLITTLGLGLLTVTALVAAALAAGELRSRAIRRARFQNAPMVGLAAPPNPRSAFFEGMRRMGQSAAVRDPSQISDIRMRLTRAGFHGREAAVLYLGARAGALGVATVGAVLLMPMALKGGGPTPAAMAFVLASAAMWGPDQFLRYRQRQNELEYGDGFPDLLDLLVASVEAGLSLDAAVARVSDELARRYPNLAIHLRLLTLELRAGKSRKEAWSAFADRLGIDDARALSTMLRQSEDMGTSLGETLSVFSVDMRQKRMLRAEEKALALPVKLTVPLILFIFPCLLGVLMLPAVFRLMQSFSHMN
ncbi:MAG TPA: type II secretion system F family protein [Phenylobacterium sp.]|nr:type II secretion system F family protein [Phenylobacterium sp.]